MARKRLTPAKPEFLSDTPPAAAAPAPQDATRPPRLSGPPIAQVAGDAAAAGALAELSADMERARADGLLLMRIHLSDIAPDHLARDRVESSIESGDEDMRSLCKSIFDRGQRTPIEVTQIEGAHRYGLISGWRRFHAIQSLKEQTGDAKFDSIIAVLRTPKDAGDAYVSMVEENEIRLGLSYYERAQVVLETVRRGVFETEKQALQTLFASASRAKRSRIKAFIDLYRKLGDVLQYPTHIPERFGLQLIYAMRDDPALEGVLKKGLPAYGPYFEPDAEFDKISELTAAHRKALEKAGKAEVPRAEHLTETLRETLPGGLKLELKGKKITLSGRPVGPDLFDKVFKLLQDM